MQKTICLLFMLSSYALQAQKQSTLSGYIKDAASGEDLIGAMIYVKEISTGTSANAYGFYSLSLPPASIT